MPKGSKYAPGQMLFVDEDGDPELFHPVFEDANAIGPLDEKGEVSIVLPELHDPGEHCAPGTMITVIEEIPAERVLLWRKDVGYVRSTHTIYRVLVSASDTRTEGIIRFIG